MNSDPKSS